MTAAGELQSSAGHPAEFSPLDALGGWMQDIAPYGIFTTDTDLRVQTWNQWLVSHSGLAVDKVIGRPLVELYPEIKSRRLDEHYHRALCGQVSVLSTALHKYLLPFRPATREAETGAMLQTVRIAPLSSGMRTLGTVTTIEDVTQRERHAVQLQRQQEHDRLLSSALGVLLQSHDPLRDVAGLFPTLTLPLGYEAYLNHTYDAPSGTLRLNAAAGILPRQRELLTTLRLGEGLCGQCAAQRRPLIRTHLREADDESGRAMAHLGFHAYCCFPLLIEDRLLGTLAFASSTHATIAPDQLDCLSTVSKYVAVAMDRALREQALREAKRSLAEHAGQLETKVRERTARLHETIAQLESFSYTVAHDLRAPIRSLKGYCDILLSDFDLPEGSTTIVERLQRSTDRLDALTRDLLKFSRVSRQDVVLEPLDVSAVVQDAVIMSPSLREEMLTVQEPLCKVWAQRTLLQQCLANLFDNAVKFVPTGTRPAIVVRCELSQGGATAAAAASTGAFIPATHRLDSSAPCPDVPAAATIPEARVRIWIEDNGIGIPPEAHQKIFGIFERVSGNDHIEGTGIGLAIVARAVQQMGGRCGVESELGRGARFWLEFASGDGPRPGPRLSA